ELPVTMVPVLRRASRIAARPYRQTPLDFVDDLKPSWALNVQTFMKMPVGPSERPIQRIGDTWLPWLTWTERTCLCLATMVYSAIHLSGWNFHFPTRTEQILWRVSSLILLGATSVFWLLKCPAIIWRHHGGQELFVRFFTRKSNPPASQQKCLHETPFEPRELPLVWEFWGIFPVAFIYALARFYIVVESILSLRSLPLTAYLTVDGSSFIPNI
ncbi:hypothetical protein BU16DRAFT_462990, partial [Lophium mytilinum]